MDRRSMGVGRRLPGALARRGVQGPGVWGRQDIPGWARAWRSEWPERSQGRRGIWTLPFERRRDFQVGARHGQSRRGVRALFPPPPRGQEQQVFCLSYPGQSHNPLHHHVDSFRLCLDRGENSVLSAVGREDWLYSQEGSGSPSVQVISW